MTTPIVIKSSRSVVGSAKKRIKPGAIAPLPAVQRKWASLAAAAGLLSATLAHASTIAFPGSNTATTDYVSVATGATFPTSDLGTAGYQLFSFGADGGANNTPSSNLPAWASVAPHNGYYWGSTDTDLDVNSTETATGEILFAGVSSTLTVETLATITLSGTIPSEFQLGLLDDNTPNSASDTDLSVSDTQGGASAATVNTSSGKSNHFYLFDVSGATAGDVISITGTVAANNDNAELSGIAFDVVGTPEPATLSLLSIGAAGLLTRRRRKP